MTRNIAKKGFDMQLAAGYQLWGGLLTPIMLPAVVGLAGLLYGVRIWIPPGDMLLQIVEKQSVPLLVGILLAHFLPIFSAKAQPWMNGIGNAVLTLGIIAMLWIMRSKLAALLTWWLPVGALLLASGSIAAIRLLVRADDLTLRTLSICNANRHIGLALLLSGQYLHMKKALPAVAAYALVAPFVMGFVAKFFHKREESLPVPEQFAFLGAKLSDPGDGVASVIGVAAFGAVPGVREQGLASVPILQSDEIGLLGGVLQRQDETFHLATLRSLDSSADLCVAQAGQGRFVRSHISGIFGRGK